MQASIKVVRQGESCWTHSMKPPPASQTWVTEGLSLRENLDLKGTRSFKVHSGGLTGQSLGDGLLLCLGHHCSKDKGCLKRTPGKRPIDLDVKRVKGSDSG